MACLDLDEVLRELPTLLSTREVAEFFGVSMKAVYIAIKNKHIPAFKDPEYAGKRYLITKEGLRVYLENCLSGEYDK
ncbi:MAG: helix-turn-helix domain-containing protein [Spirochaetia bacterium]